MNAWETMRDHADPRTMEDATWTGCISYELISAWRKLVEIAFPPARRRIREVERVARALLAREDPGAWHRGSERAIMPPCPWFFIRKGGKIRVALLIQR